MPFAPSLLLGFFLSGLDARRSGDLRLATLLSQDPRDDTFRALMRLHYQQAVEAS